MATRCKRRLSVQRIPGSAAGASLTLGADAAEVTLRAVDAAGAPIAFTVAVAAFPASLFHFAINEVYTIDRLALDAELELTIVSAAASVIEVLLWEG